MSRNISVRNLRVFMIEPGRLRIVFTANGGFKGTHQGLRRRKNCGLFVGGRFTNFLMPSSVMLAGLVTQLDGAVSVSACSNVKLVVSADGQETLTSLPERALKARKTAGTHGQCMRKAFRPLS